MIYGDIKIFDTVIETKVLGEKNNLIRVTHLYTKPLPGTTGILLCQMVGYHSHDEIFQEFNRQNNSDDCFMS